MATTKPGTNTDYVGKNNGEINLPKPPGAVSYTARTSGPAAGYTADQVGDAVTYDAALVGRAIGYDPSLAEAQTYDPETGKLTTAEAYLRTVQPDELVKNQLYDLLENDKSPLLRRAWSKGADYMNSRGGVNSSLGAQASEAALIDAALPIAQADAAAFQTAARDNQHYINEIAVFNAAQANQMEMFNVDQVNTAAYRNSVMVNEVRMFNASSENQAKEFWANQENINQRFNVDQTNQQRSQYARDQNVNNRFNVSESNSARRFSAEQHNITERFNTSEQNRAGMFNAGEENAMNRTAYGAQVDAEMQRFRADHDAMIRGNEQAARIADNFSNNVAAVMADPNLDEAAKARIIQTMRDTARDAMNVAGSISGSDYSGYLDFEIRTAPPASAPGGGSSGGGGGGGGTDWRNDNVGGDWQ